MTPFLPFRLKASGSRRRDPIAWAALAFLLAAFAAPAQQSTNVPVATLDAVVAEALARNPELKYYEAEIAAAKAGRRSAGLRANPELSAGVGHKGVRSAGLGDEGVAWSVSVMQPFEWPGRVGLRKAIANHDVELAELGRARFQAALAARVRSLAFGLFAARERSAAAAEVVQRFGELREVLVQRDPAGLTPLLETRVIEATELNYQRRSAEAALAAESALLELNQLRGASPEAALALVAPKPQFRVLGDRNTLVALAWTNNFDLRVRAAELAQQGFRVELARNERYPAISVGPTFSEERAGGDRERIIGLGVSLPLPLWNRNKDGVETAEARRTQAEVSYHAAGREVQRQVLQAAMAYESKLREMARWRPDAVEHFKNAAELADRHYRLGAVPVATYVELQKQYLAAVESLLDTKKEAIEAVARLEELVGQTLSPVSSTPEAK